MSEGDIMKAKNSDIEKIEVFSGISKNSIIEIKNSADVIELKKNRLFTLTDSNLTMCIF